MEKAGADYGVKSLVGSGPYKFQEWVKDTRVVLFRHALRSALLPVVTVVGLQFGSLLGGAVIVESVFARQGIGRLLVSAIQSRDFPLAQGCVLLIALVYVVVNLVVDLLYAYLDPRVRYSGSL